MSARVNTRASGRVAARLAIRGRLMSRSDVKRASRAGRHQNRQMMRGGRA
jgi:hypothetical protein